MIIWSLLKVFLLGWCLESVCGDDFTHYIVYTQPEQIHLSLTENADEMVVTWNTRNDTESWVEYGVDGLVKKAQGSSKAFTDGGSLKKVQYVHRVVLSRLLPKTKYFYHCGSILGWSQEFWFVTINNTTNWAPKLAVYGDMGNINARSLPFLQEETLNNVYDAIIHNGDYGYNMDDNEGEVGDQFMRQIEPIAAYVPYMVSPGNHEAAYNFSHVKERFTMPGNFENMFYSFNLGPAHFISFNTEAYYSSFVPATQYSWLEQDLKEANKPENRDKRPWIITYGHRPMYCSNNDDDDCTKNPSPIRDDLEKLFYDNGVDVEFWAHEHSYERLWPVFNKNVINGTSGDPYVNPKAPVHVTTGSAGCQENTDGFIENPLPWSAFRSSDYGYARLQIFNTTHLYVEQVSVDQGGNVIDKLWVIKEKHGSYE